MSLLTIVQTACQRIGIASPTVVVGSSDLSVIQLFALVNKEGKQLSTGASVGLSYDWQALQTEASFTSVATESQGAIATIAPGYKAMITGTIWDRTRRLPAYGSMSPQDWQNYQAWGISSPFPKYRIRGGLLRLLPVPAAGDAYYFEYQTKYWCTDSTGVTLKPAFTADTDIASLDEDLITDGLVWRWKHAKGLDYAEDFTSYQRDANTAILRDTERPMLDLGCNDRSLTGVVVPIGSWNT